jgi:hypothetical protein
VAVLWGNIIGQLTCDGKQLEFDDRALVHLQVVIGLKLRRRESFFFSWNDTPSGRSSVWLQAGIPLYFKYHISKSPSLNRAWIESLMISANSSQGLQLVDEPDPSKH